MSKRTYYPDRGDLIELNFQPSAGSEIDKRRPAVVLTPVAYNRRTGLCLAVPVSSKTDPGPLWLDLPSGYLPKPSIVLCDYVKNLDFRERSATFLAKLPPSFVQDIVSNILDLIDPVG